MLKSIVELVIGDLGEKKAYRQFRKRISALPKDYRFAFKKIRHYIYSVGSLDGGMEEYTDLTIFTDLVELFEASAAAGREVLDVVGADVDMFCDEFMLAAVTNMETRRTKLNKEIIEYFHREDK